MDRVTRITFGLITWILLLNVIYQLCMWYTAIELQKEIKFLKQQQRVQDILIQKNAENTWRVWYDHYQ